MRRMHYAALLALALLSAPAYGQAAPGRFTLKSAVLGEERALLVRVPANYERGSERYPVLYMTDGGAHMGHTSATVEFLARNGRIPELIVVGITNTNRRRDLTPTGVEAFPGSGGADKFLKFIETELIPEVERRYRTQSYRIFAGHSLGGLNTLHAFFSRPELFNAYIAVSPTMTWDQGLPVKRAEEFFKARKELDRTLFLAMADEGGEMLAGFNRLKEVIAKSPPRGLVWEAMLMEDEDHGSVVLRSHYFGLRKAFDGWRVPPETAAGGLPAVEAHYQQLSRRVGFPVLVPELLMNQIGYQLLGAGKTDEAIAAFKTNIERYPKSANVYDSLAEGYEKSGRPELARPNYEKAYQLGRENNDPNVELYKANLDRVAGKK